MDERACHLQHLLSREDFRSAVFGFFAILLTLDADSVLDKDLRRRVRDKFRPISEPATAF